MCMCACMHACVSVCVCVDVGVCVCVNACSCVCMCIYCVPHMLCQHTSVPCRYHFFMFFSTIVSVRMHTRSSKCMLSQKVCI